MTDEISTSKPYWYNHVVNTRTAYVFLILLIAYRFWIMSQSKVNLHFDEAQYWLWAQNLQWGYFSKPPMIAWGIALQQSLFGEQVIALKSQALFLYPIITLVIYRMAKAAHNQTVASYSALLLATMPAVSMSSLMITTDVFFILFWALALSMVFDAIRKDKMHLWGWAGFFAGMGLQTKYTMLLFLPSTILCLYLRKELFKPRVLTGVGLASGIALLIWLPNLWWNYTHEMASFQHLYEISQVEKHRFDITELLSFIMAQFAVLGFGSSLLFIRYCLARFSKETEDRSICIWMSFFIVFFTVISAQALWSRAFANWAAPCYVSAVIWLSAVMVEQRKTGLLNLAILINLCTMGAVYHYESIYKVFNIPLTYKTDPMRRMRGWDELGKKLSIVLSENPNRLLMAENRKILTELIYYVKPHPFDAVLFNPSKSVTNHFHLNQSMQDYTGKDFLWVSTSPSVTRQQQFCKKAQLTGEITIPSYQNTTKAFYIISCDAFTTSGLSA